MQLCRHKHSTFSSSFPIHLFKKWTEEAPDEDFTPQVEESATSTETSDTPESPIPTSLEDEAIIEEVAKGDEGIQIPLAQKMKNVTKEQWSHLNVQPPLWTRLDYFFPPYSC
jgi:heat shock protein beta